MDALHFKSATELTDLIGTRKVSATELLELFLTRIEKHNPKLNAVIWMDVEKPGPAPGLPIWRSPRAKSGVRCTACP